MFQPCEAHLCSVVDHTVLVFVSNPLLQILPRAVQHGCPTMASDHLNRPCFVLFLQQASSFKPLSCLAVPSRCIQLKLLQVWMRGGSQCAQANACCPPARSAGQQVPAFWLCCMAVLLGECNLQSWQNVRHNEPVWYLAGYVGVVSAPSNLFIIDPETDGIESLQRMERRA